jgi:hypothetical protein
LNACESQKPRLWMAKDKTPRCENYFHEQKRLKGKVSTFIAAAAASFLNRLSPADCFPFLCEIKKNFSAFVGKNF